MRVTHKRLFFLHEGNLQSFRRGRKGGEGEMDTHIYYVIFFTINRIVRNISILFRGDVSLRFESEIYRDLTFCSRHENRIA